MRIAVTGGTGNVGTSVLEALARDPAVEEVLVLARRTPGPLPGPSRFLSADIARDDLAPVLRGFDVVIHLAWLIQPGRTEAITRAVNVAGSERVLRAVADARVPALVYASSVGAYSPGPKRRAVDEHWPTEGVQSSFYSRHKAAVERHLDRFEAEHPEVRVARLRPGLIFKREAGAEIRRLFGGPFLPATLIRESLIPVIPDVPGLRFQAVHSRDVGEAYYLVAVNEDARGAYNIAAEPVLDPPELARILGARTVRVPAGAVRALAAATFRARLQPTEPGWLDLALSVPIMDTSRARRELGWSARVSAADALLELMAGMRDGAGADTPPLAPHAGGPGRLRELLSGVGKRP